MERKSFGDTLLAVGPLGCILWMQVGMCHNIKIRVMFVTVRT